LEDINNELWVATFDHGINKLTTSTQNHYPANFEHFQSTNKKQNGLITDQIITLFEDRSKNIWIGSGGGGLFRWFPSEERFISYASEVSGDIIYNIAEDAEHNLWVSTNRGLTRLKYNNGIQGSNSFLQENGLQGNIFKKDAFYEDTAGNFFMGGNRGFNYFDPLTIQTDDFTPPVEITEVKVMSKPVSISNSSEKPLVLDHIRNSFSIAFSALSFSQPENNKYAVKLEGLEENWRTLDAGMRHLNYANLKPGRYTLKIKGSNSHGHWNPNPEEFYIKVKPAPYKTGWAFSFYAFIFTSFIFTIFRMEKKNQQVKHALEIEHIERQKADKLNSFKQKLFANISHEFLTPLNILSCLIDD